MFSSFMIENKLIQIVLMWEENHISIPLCATELPYVSAIISLF